MNPSRIASLKLRQILDSRGRPTVEADVILHDGSLGRASVPSGASTGKYEVRELRDGDAESYESYGVQSVVATALQACEGQMQGVDALDQTAVDATLRWIDGTPDLGRVGANPILALSLATARAAAAHVRQPLHVYLRSLVPGVAPSMPMPMTNILSGGAHAGGGMDFQDFLAMPVGATTYSQALEWIARVRSAAARLMAQEGRVTLLADEGGLSPGFESAEQALTLMVRAIEAARLRPGHDMAITIDVAASQLYVEEQRCYHLRRAGRELTSDAMMSYVFDLCGKYPIVSVEDPFDQDDWEAWQSFTRKLGDRSLQLVGDDFFATNAQRLASGIERQVANAVLIKVNQNGTLSGTLDVMALARKAGYATVVSARSGETEDSFIADLAVATGAGQIKIGSVRNSERQSKYNQLLRIEEEAGLTFAAFMHKRR
ncbi:phosphopyruvate hydratase [Peristeroidobacter soli]|uniref:phosphopyruvate hydratase n=1 Tax=Peristeroidobacter soli TaxID=2497877 RepID=UPI00101D2EA8|nr:phosphopyruvate hydratase [Peristeroidobacter soli]